MENKFKLKSDFKPAGDQPQAIKSLVEGIKKGVKHQTLLGVTGSGKTFTIANVIEKSESRHLFWRTIKHLPRNLRKNIAIFSGECRALFCFLL